MFLKNLEKLMEENKINKSILSRGSGIPYTTIVGFWERGVDNIKLSTLVKLSEYFNVTLDYLLKGTKKALPEEQDELSNEERYIIKSYRDLNETGKEYILQTIEILSQTHKKDINTIGESNKDVG